MPVDSFIHHIMRYNYNTFLFFQLRSLGAFLLRLHLDSESLCQGLVGLDTDGLILGINVCLDTLAGDLDRADALAPETEERDLGHAQVLCGIPEGSRDLQYTLGVLELDVRRALLLDADAVVDVQRAGSCAVAADGNE